MAASQSAEDFDKQFKGGREGQSEKTSLLALDNGAEIFNINRRHNLSRYRDHIGTGPELQGTHEARQVICNIGSFDKHPDYH